MYQSEVLSVSSISTSSSRDYNQLGMETLLKLKRTYINRFEYEKAKKVQAVINERKIEDINGIIQECIDKIDQKINEVETDLQKKRELTNSSYKFKELDILEKIDNAFLVVKERHVKELATIEKQKALAYVRAIHKPIKESRELLAQSKRLAENDDFDGAVRIREKSRKVKEEIIQTRKDQVNQIYELMRKKLYTKHKSELQILSGKLSSALNKNETEKIESLRSHDKLAKNTIIFHQQKILGEMSQKIRSKDNKLAFSDQVSRFFNQRFSQFNEHVEQADKEALKSQSQTVPSSEVDPFNLGDESTIVTEGENQNINFDNSNIPFDQNMDILSESHNSDLEKINDNDAENNKDLEEDNNLEEDLDAVDNNPHSDNDQIEQQNYLNDNEEDYMPNQQDDIPNQQDEDINSSEKKTPHDSLADDEVYIEDSEPHDFQNNNEEEQIYSEQNQNNEYISPNIEEEEEAQNEDLLQEDKSDQLCNLSGGAIELQREDDSQISNNSGSPNFAKSQQSEKNDSAVLDDILNSDHPSNQDE